MNFSSIWINLKLYSELLYAYKYAHADAEELAARELSNLLEGHNAYLTASLILNIFKELAVTPTWQWVREKHCRAKDCIWGSLVRIILSTTAKENSSPWRAPRTEKGCEIPY